MCIAYFITPAMADPNKSAEMPSLDFLVFLGQMEEEQGSLMSPLDLLPNGCATTVSEASLQSEDPNRSDSLKADDSPETDGSPRADHSLERPSPTICQEIAPLSESESKGVQP